MDWELLKVWFFFFSSDLVEGGILWVAILEWMCVSYFVTRLCAMICFLIEREDVAEEEGSVFRTAYF